MNKICTSIEQSQKLIELGVDIKTADMWWNFYSVTTDNTTPQIIHLDTPWVGNFNWDNKSDNIPCWSLAALLSVLPFHLIVNNQRYVFCMIKGLDKNGETYAIKYAIFNTTFYLHLTDFYNNPVDACYEMILKLHEQNLL